MNRALGPSICKERYINVRINEKFETVRAGAAILFALASLYNFHGSAVTGGNRTGLDDWLRPASQETIQSGPAVRA